MNSPVNTEITESSPRTLQYTKEMEEDREMLKKFSNKKCKHFLFFLKKMCFNKNENSVSKEFRKIPKNLRKRKLYARPQVYIIGFILKKVDNSYALSSESKSEF